MKFSRVTLLLWLISISPVAIADAVAEDWLQHGVAAHANGDEMAAFAAFCEAAKRGSAAAYVRLALMALFGQGPQHDLAWLQDKVEVAAFDGDSAYAEAERGGGQWGGEFGGEDANYQEEVLHRLARRAAHGDADLQLLVGLILAGRVYDADLLSADRAEAMRWIRKAAEGGQPEARAWLAAAAEKPARP